MASVTRSLLAGTTAAAAASARRSALSVSAAPSSSSLLSPHAAAAAAASRTFSTSHAARATHNPAEPAHPQPLGDGSGLSPSVAAAPGAIKDPQLGDYPDLPPISLQRRRWNPNWWDGQEKRNFGETLHEEHDALSVWAPDVPPIPPSSALFQFGLAALAMATFAGIVYVNQFDEVCVRRSYPRGGLKAELGGTAFAVRP
ncbi:hypothetical protein V8E36_006074 [Tilletia maclaganii]